MPCLWLQHNNSQLFVSLGILDAIAANIAATPPIGGQIASPRMFLALVDTGAQRTMISNNVVNALGLPPQGKIPIQGVGHTVTYHNGYLFHVAFTLPIIVQGKPVPNQLAVFVHPSVIYGAELTAVTGFDVLLGMDILSSGSLKVEGSGHFSFSF